MELLAQKPKLEKTDAFKAEKNPNRVYDISLLRLPEIVERDGRYVAYSNRVVCDCYTKLEWLAGPDRDTSWDEAYTWVESLNSGGGMWALPPLELLRGLYRKNLRKNELSPLSPQMSGVVRLKMMPRPGPPRQHLLDLSNNVTKIQGLSRTGKTGLRLFR